MAQADHDFVSDLANSLAQYINDQTTLDNTNVLTAADNDLTTAITGANTYLNPNGGTTTDVLTAVNVPGSIAPGAPSGFTFNTNAPPPQYPNLFAWANPLRGAPALFGPQTGALPDDHVEPATPLKTPRARMDRGNSEYVAWLDTNQARTRPSTTTTAPPNNSADLGEEARRTDIDPKSKLTKQVSNAVDRAATVEPKTKPTLIENYVEYTKGVAYGFAVDGLVGDGETIWTLAKWSWKYSFLNPDFSENVYEGYQFAKEVASKIDIQKWAEVIATAASNGWNIVSSVHTHQLQGLTPQQEFLLVKAGEILLEVESLVKQMIPKGLDARLMGRIVGMVAYEFVTDAVLGVLTVGTGGATAPIAAAKIAALVKKLDRIAGRFLEPLIIALKHGQPLCKKIEGFVDAIKALSMACFVAGTPLLTPDGEKPIEQFQVGDPILACPENDPHAPVRIQNVDALFKLEAMVIELRVGGQLIETTAEHPFFVAGQGWVRARDLQPGDPLLGHDERVTLVASILQTDRVRTVYNIRVTEDQTYFVGRKSWGFSIWVHNAYSFKKVGNTFEVLDDAGNTVRKSVTLEARKTGPGKWDIVDPSDGFVVKRDAGVGDVRGLAENLNGPLTFGKNSDSKVRKHIDQVRNRGPIKDPIPSPGKGGIEQVQQIIRDRVSRGGGRATTYADEAAIAFEDGGVTYIFRPNGEFWTVLGNP